MKKILISLTVALVLCVGSIGTAVALTAHQHNCVQNECVAHEHADGEVHAAQYYTFVCMKCKATRTIRATYRPAPPYHCGQPMVSWGF